MCSKSLIYGCGYLNRIKLKESKDGYIYGFLSIRTSQNNVVSFNVYQHEITKNNKENPSYKCFKTVMEEYKDFTTGNPDFVEIKIRENFPNANLYFNGRIHKNLKFITRTAPKPSRIAFKIYGVKVTEVDGENIICEYLDYDISLREIPFLNKTKVEISVGDIIDATGIIVEGLYDGLPVDSFHIKNVRQTTMEIDFSLGKKYIPKDEDPF